MYEINRNYINKHNIPFVYPIKDTGDLVLESHLWNDFAIRVNRSKWRFNRIGF